MALRGEYWIVQWANNAASEAGVRVGDRVLASGTRQGYFFELSGATSTWSAIAFPISEKTGRRAFFVDETGVIRFTVDGGHLGLKSPAIGR